MERRLFLRGVQTMLGFRRLTPGLLAVTLLAMLLQSAARAVTPDSPEVQQMIKQGVDFLLKPNVIMHGAGEDALIGLALFKAGFDASHPRVQQSLASAQALARNSTTNGLGSDCYSAAVCCILMCDVDPNKYHDDINLIISGFLQRQRPNGCWSYAPFKYDDTSQTQYCLLCLWVAAQNGFDIPVDAVERCAGWVIGMQHPDGGWAYRAPYNEQTNPTPVFDQQHIQVSHSMTAAGAGMAYLCYHLFGFASGASPGDGQLPSAVQVVDDQKQHKGVTLKSDKVSRAALQNSMRLADAWFAANLRFDAPIWTHYYMYGFERYKAFQELVLRQNNAEPAWYNQGVDFLRRTQQPNGAWRSPIATTANTNEPIDTSFAILFLTRSSKKTINKVMLEGVMRSGKGLPKDLSTVRIADGQILNPEMVENVDGMLKLLEEQKDDLDPETLADQLVLDPDPQKRSQQLEHLRRLVHHKNYKVRLSAVKTLSTARDFGNVPALIYALSDPDTNVSHAALDGLRFTSRRLSTPGIPENATAEQMRQLQEYWKAWYRSVRPDGGL